MVRNCTQAATRNVEVSSLLDAIKRGKYRKPIENIRRVYGSTKGDADAKRRAIDPLKKKLPAVTFSGQFKRRAGDALTEHSGLLCVDLDSLGEKLREVRIALCE